MYILQFGILFWLFLRITNAATFTCFHGEGSGKNFTAKACPSKICIIYKSACGGYVSTTCYNDQNPMKVVSIFKAASFYYDKSPKSSSLGYCTTSECNKDIKNLKAPFIIQADPSSFDYLLSKSVKKEIEKKKLQNGIKLPAGIGINETLKFVGQTFKTSKSPWIVFSCTYSNWTSMRFQINFDLKKLKLISKSVTVISASQRIKQINETWTKVSKPGGKITILVKNKNPGFGVTVNGMEVSKFLNDKKIKDINLVTYGGAWTMAGASIIDKNGKTTPLKMLPTFYSDLIPTNIAKLKGNSKNPKLVAQEYSLPKGYQYDDIVMDAVEQNEMTDYEFRISENPGSDLIKLQFQFMPTPPTSEYVILWKRIKNIWSSAGIVWLNEGIKCYSYTIRVTKNGINFLCGNKNAHNISYPNFGSLVKHRFQINVLPTPCPKKDPFNRLLGRMPRLSDYAF